MITDSHPGPPGLASLKRPGSSSADATNAALIRSSLRCRTP